MADENTIYDENEATQLDNSTTPATKETTPTTAPAPEPQANEPKKGTWKKVAIGTGSGLVFGSAATVLTSFTTANGENTSGENNPDSAPEQNPLVDDQISMATCVDDDMSFSQAFAAARAEVGPGGAFEWHGQIYGTYTAEEWDSMSAAERDEYNNHFAWSSSSATSTTSGSDHTASTTTHSDDVQVTEHETTQETYTTHTNAHSDPIGNTTTNDDVVVVNHTEPADEEVQVLGVVHDSETDMNIGGMIVDNQEVILIDVDNDQTFDVMVSDQNNDGQLQDNEMSDISNLGLTVNDLGGYTDPNANMIASNDEIDYTNDISVDA